YQFPTLEVRKIQDCPIEYMGLSGIGLVEGFGVDLKAEFPHFLKDMVPPGKADDLLVVDRIVGLGVDHVEQGIYFGKCIPQMSKPSDPLLVSPVEKLEATHDVPDGGGPDQHGAQ